MGGGPSIIRRPTQKSNIEFVSALRARFAAAQRSASLSGTISNGDSVPHINGKEGHSWISWTSSSDDKIYIPSLDFDHSGLREEHSSYEITVKLFFLPSVPSSSRCAQTREAIRLVLDELHIPSIDLLIVSFPGMAFDALDDDGNHHHEADADGLSGDITEPMEAPPEGIDTMIETWECLEELHKAGVIARLGVSEFGAERLARFLKRAKIRPAVDQINVRDCCVVPRDLILFAKQEKIELLTHNDCTNILPSATVRELLGSGNAGAGIISDGSNDERLQGEIAPQWVIKYTAVVRDRGVVENKGYFAMAEVASE